MLKDLVSKLWPLHRTLASDGTDEALRIIGEECGPAIEYTIETYAPGKQVWTWRVPARYVVHEAYLETEEGERVVDFSDNALHLVSYSLPIDRILSWEELEPHLYYSKRPHAIPWVFKYYNRSWGFCLSKEQFDELPRHKRYRAVIRSEFITDPAQGFRVGVATIHPQGGKSPEAGEILICSHICHPHQANDDIAGVVTAIEVARRLAEHPLPPGSMSVRFLFCPETIGSVCYLSHHEELIPSFKGGIFCEMTGNLNSIVLQRSRQDTHLMDRIARYVLQRRLPTFREGPFLEVIANDEKVINAPGVDIPCISISRWPYPEYHTSDDNPDIIHEEMLLEAADVVEEIVRICASNYIPRRMFRGPVFLSGHGLWVDARENKPLHLASRKIALFMFDNKRSVFDIADELNLEYWDLWEYMGQFQTKGLVQVSPIPSVSAEQC